MFIYTGNGQFEIKLSDLETLPDDMSSDASSHRRFKIVADLKTDGKLLSPVVADDLFLSSRDNLIVLTRTISSAQSWQFEQ